METMFWADQIARKIAEKDKKEYVIEGGIAPSAKKHIGSFREIITGYFVKLALEDMNKKVKFIYSWDAYDRLKKISASIPEDKRKELEKYIGVPQGLIPDPFGCHSSYAKHFEKIVEEEAERLKVKPEFLYQDKLYQKGIYADSIKIAMNQKDEIRKILDKYRTEKLPKTWWPIRVYCEKCNNSDNTTVLNYDGKYTIKYKCNDCEKEFTVNFKKNGIVKPVWRVDWPMRWNYYNVDFEPSGKDHMVAGSSYVVGSEIVKKVFGTDPPYAIIYEFVGKKGDKGKMSASKGNIITVTDVLGVYLPEIVRYMFAGTKPAKQFTIPFDDNVFKIYDDFYLCERIYFGKEKVTERDKTHWSRVYEMSTLLKPPKKLPIQPNFKQAMELINIYREPSVAIKTLKLNNKFDKERYLYILKCAKNWMEKYGKDYMYELVEIPKVKLNDKEKNIVKDFIEVLNKNPNEKQMIDAFAKISEKNEVKVREFFKIIYLVLFNKEKGPRLTYFIEATGKDKIIKILEKV